MRADANYNLNYNLNLNLNLNPQPSTPSLNPPSRPALDAGPPPAVQWRGSNGRGRGRVDIQGLQKMTLLDWPGKVACTVFLGGCELRCPFCHNAELLTPPFPESIPQEQLLSFLGKRRGLLDGVCVTGGEPLLRPDLAGLLCEIKALGFPVKLDTNGAHPAALAALWERGLVDYVAMDIKNSPERYAETAGVPGLDLGPIRDSSAWLLEGRVDYEFRTTAVRQFHDAQSFRDIGAWIAGARRYYIQNFIDRETVAFAGLEGFSRQELEGFARAAQPFVERVEVRGAE